MSALSQSADATSAGGDVLSPWSRRRSPAVVVTLSLIAGILADRWWEGSILLWSALAVTGLVPAWLLRQRRPALAAVALLVACAAIGGLRHHLAWWSVPSDDVSRLLSTSARPMCVRGIVESPVVILRADDSELTPEWMRIDRSTCNLRCEVLADDDQIRAVTGRVRLLVTGHLLHVDVGDRVEIVGQLRAPRGPTNPGAFDYRQYLRRQGVRTSMSCDHPEAVQLLAPAVTGRFQRWRSDLRSECERMFTKHLGVRTAPVATSLLLGERSTLPTDVEDAFVNSGTMHLLAISGLHVSILAGLVLLCCRLLNLHVGMTTLVVLAGVAAFACITDLRPPAIRASVLACVVAAGWPMYRSSGGANLVAVCGLVVLLINPTDLFDIGTQLSFLAVIAIGWSMTFIGRLRSGIDQESLLPRLLTPRPGVVPTCMRFLAEGYIVTLAIWLVTLPLTAAAFHMAAPVGFVVNVVLVPYSAVVLWLGFLTMIVGLALPFALAVPAVMFDWSLRGLLGVVDGAAALELGHASLAGPSTGWLVVFYALLSAVLLWGRAVPVRRWGAAALWGWIVAGQFVALLPERRDSLRCTVLDVGHGCCVVLQLPGGETLLYDAGMLAGAGRGQRIIESALWELGVRRIDGIIVSHADIDHFNAVAGLVETIPTGTLLTSRSFLDFSQAPVASVCEAAQQTGVPIRLLHEGDRLGLHNEQVGLKVLHPPDDWHSDHDNAGSLVLEIEFAGRTILLTGDLEREGLDRLMHSSAQSPIDVLLAPHHGSRLANPRSFAQWGRPQIVIASGGRPAVGETLRGVYDSARRVLTTHAHGAVTVDVRRDGDLKVTSVLGQSS